MNYGALRPLDIANGPGVRVSLFVSGCRNHCKGCFQPETWNFDYGQPFTARTMVELFQMLQNPHVAGLSILGGDPFEPENIERVTKICRLIKSKDSIVKDKTIWVWTGYLWEDVKNLEIMNYIDVLVDGPFVESQKDLTLFYRGSNNQRVIDVKKSIEAGSAIRLEGDWK